MKEAKTQAERLEYLVEAFKNDSVIYKDVPTPQDDEGKRKLLRSLMNVRLPKYMPDEVINVQDEYLSALAEEKSPVSTDEIPTVREEFGSEIEEGGRISLWQGDITRLKTGAIVNAANSQMLGCFLPLHSCIDNCIHTYAGIQLRAECYEQMTRLRADYGKEYEMPTASPMITDGYNLPAEHVIHVAGPIVSGKLTEKHERALADCYANVLRMCAENNIKTVAFCCISTGVFNFPGEKAAEIAVKTVAKWLKANIGIPERVIFNVFTDKDRRIYERIFKRAR